MNKRDPNSLAVFGTAMGHHRGQATTPRKTTYKDKKDKKENTKLEKMGDRPSDIVSTEAVIDTRGNVYGMTVSAVDDQEAWCGGGKDLALINREGQVKQKIKLDYELYDIAVTLVGELLVTQRGGSNIRKYLQDGQCINICNTEPYMTRGLCVTLHQDILVCLYNNNTQDYKVERISTDGQVKQTIQRDQNNQSLFRCPWFVAENINGNICVVDGEDSSSSIVVLNKDGVLRFRYPEPDQSSNTIGWCFGIACDKCGFILVSDRRNNKIHQIDSDGRFVKHMLTEQNGIQRPYGLSIDVKGQLWVCNEDGNNLKVFKY